MEFGVGVGLFSDAEEKGLDAVVLLKRNGTVLGAWSRDSMDLGVVCLMTSTLLGSVETIMQAIHSRVPQTLRLESEDAQLVAVRLESRLSLVLIAPVALRETELRMTALAYAARVAQTATLAQVPEPPIRESLERAPRTLPQPKGR